MEILKDSEVHSHEVYFLSLKFSVKPAAIQNKIVPNGSGTILRKQRRGHHGIDCKYSVLIDRTPPASVQTEAADPVRNVIPAGIAAEAFAGLPVACACHLSQQLAALTKAGGSGRAERDDSLPVKSLFFTKLLTGHAAIAHQIG